MLIGLTYCQAVKEHEEELTSQVLGDEAAADEEETVESPQVTVNQQKQACVDACYARIYEDTNTVQDICHESIHYIWDILTDRGKKEQHNYSIDDIDSLIEGILEKPQYELYSIDIVAQVTTDYPAFQATKVHTFLIEQNFDKYKIYQSYAGKYTIGEWLNGKLDHHSSCNRLELDETIKNIFYNKTLFDQLDSKMKLTVTSAIFLNENNIKLLDQFPKVVHDFGGENCITQENMRAFLTLFEELLFKISEYDLVGANSISENIFGTEMFTTPEDDDLHLDQYGLPEQQSPFPYIQVTQHKVTCKERISK
jgi:hypothetical protein